MPAADGNALHSRHGAFSSFLELAGANERRSVFLDVGANDGATTKRVWNELCASRAPLPAAEQRPLLVLVEAQPNFVAKLVSLVADLNSQSHACRVELVGAAAWTQDGTVSFSRNRDPRGAVRGRASNTRRATSSHCPDLLPSTC